MTRQDRIDIFIAAALTGILSNKNTQPYASIDRDYAVDAAIIIANKVIDETDYVYEEDLSSDLSRGLDVL